MPASIRKRGLPLEVLRTYDEVMRNYDRCTTPNERDGMNRLIKRFELLYQMADAYAEDILLKYYESEVVEDALCLAASGMIRWSEIVWFCEYNTVRHFSLFDEYEKTEISSGCCENGEQS